MDDTTLKFPRGSVIQFTEGEYSDFCLCGMVVTIKDCDLPALAKEYAAFENAWAGKFATWLVANGHAMPCEATEVHLGSYGRWAEEFGVDNG